MRFLVINVQTADAIVSAGSFIVAYAISVVIAGVLSAWIIDWLGDPTPRLLGLLSFNPLAHIDFLGFACLFLLGIGWGTTVPVDPEKINSPFHRLKVFIAFLIDGIIHVILGIAGFIMLTSFIGPASFSVTRSLIERYHFLTHRTIVSVYPSLSSLDIVLVYIAISFIFVNTMLAMWAFIGNTIRYLSRYVIKGRFFGSYADFVWIIITLGFFILFGGALRMAIAYTVCQVGSILGYYCSSF